MECEFFTVISIDSLLLYNCAYKIVSKQIKYYLDENLFEDLIL